MISTEWISLEHRSIATKTFGDRAIAYNPVSQPPARICILAVPNRKVRSWPLLTWERIIIYRQLPCARLRIDTWITLVVLWSGGWKSSEDKLSEKMRTDRWTSDENAYLTFEGIGECRCRYFSCLYALYLCVLYLFIFNLTCSVSFRQSWMVILISSWRGTSEPYSSTIHIHEMQIQFQHQIKTCFCRFSATIESFVTLDNLLINLALRTSSIWGALWRGNTFSLQPYAGWPILQIKVVKALINSAPFMWNLEIYAIIVCNRAIQHLNLMRTSKYFLFTNMLL